ncbi:MAG: DMT family transporter [Desulfatiglandaceae bacterium]
MKTKPVLDPRIALIIATISVSFAAIFIKFSGAPSIIIAFYRKAFATLLLLPFLFIYGREALSKISRREVFEIVAAGVALAFHFWFWIESLKHVSVANSVLLVTSHPLLVGILSMRLFGERMGSLQWVGIGIALSGIAMITAGDWKAGVGQELIGDVLALLGMVAFAVYLLAGRRLRQRVPTLVYVVPVYGVSALVLLLIAVVMSTPLIGYPALDWVIFLALAVVCTIGGHTLYNYSLAYVPASLVSVTLLGEPVLSSLFAWLLLSEVPSWFVLPGGILVLTGIYWASVGMRKAAGSWRE